MSTSPTSDRESPHHSAPRAWKIARRGTVPPARDAYPHRVGFCLHVGTLPGALLRTLVAQQVQAFTATETANGRNRVALFLASGGSSYVNGMELVVDGGTTVI